MLTNPQLSIRNDMYPYHNKIKQRIKTMSSLSTNTLTGTKNISPCLLLHFNTDPKVRPIRKHRFLEYEKVFEKL